MATRAQIEANRRNALKSTGPKSDEGKRKTRANALKHGLTGTIHVPLRHEDPQEYFQVREDFYNGWKPASEKETLQLELLISAWINIQRVERMETNLLDQAMAYTQKKNGVPLEVSWNDDLGCAMAFGDKRYEQALTMIQRYARRALRQYNEAARLLEALQKNRKREEERRKREEERRRKSEAPRRHAAKLASFGGVIQFPQSGAKPNPDRTPTSFGHKPEPVASMNIDL